MLKQAVGQSAAIRHPSLREIEGDWCCVAECREVSHAVAGHDVNVEPDVPPAHAVEEGVFGWFEVVFHVYLFNLYLFDIDILKKQKSMYIELQ